MSGITSKRCRSCSPNWNATQRETEWACNQLPSDGLTFRQKLPLGSGFDSIGPCADGHFGAIIKAFRDLRLSGATDWLRRFWPGVKRALAYAWSKDNPDRCDPDQTGILAGRRHQTMNMELFGPNSRLGSMYVAALLAAAKMADALREPDFAAKCLKMGKAGAAYIDGQLFNGKYFYQAIDLANKSVLTPFDVGRAAGVLADSFMSAYWSDAHDEIKYPFATGCIADQILGQWHAEVAGLGLFLSPGKVRTALASVHAENFRPSLADQVNRCRNYAFEAEGGLLIATYPSGTRQQVVAAAPCAEEVWSGVDYASASLMIMQGLVEEGLTVVRAVRGRHDDARCEHLMPSARGMAMVFPSYTLYSHMNVEENLRFGLENQKLAKSEIAAQVQKAADILQISLLLKRRPHQLTGGQSQRVAIGRAIVKEPKAFLFDEPLSDLDAELREKMRGELVALHQRLGSAMVYVTHDQVKAMTMADQITVSRDGRVEQAG